MSLPTEMYRKILANAQPERPGELTMKLFKQYLAFFLSATLVLATSSNGFAQAVQSTTPGSTSPPSTAPLFTAPASTTPAPVQAAQETPEQLQQLVAPIALYPDALVAQILAASTYPAQVVEADRWMQQHSNLKGDQLAQEVNKQQWDPSVKALTQV